MIQKIITVRFMFWKTGDYGKSKCMDSCIQKIWRDHSKDIIKKDLTQNGCKEVRWIKLAIIANRFVRNVNTADNLNKHGS